MRGNTDDGTNALARLRVLSEAVHAFAQATTDAEQLFDVVARRVAEIVHDSCVVLLLSEDGQTLHPAAYHSVDPDTQEAIRALFASAPVRLDEHVLAREVIRTGAPYLVPKVHPDAFRPVTTSDTVRHIDAIGVHSLLLVPLRARGEGFGLMALARFREGSSAFDDADLDFAQSIADHASLAIANARSYAAERSARAAAERALDALRVSEAATHAALEERSRFDDARRVAEERFASLTRAGILGIIVGRMDGRIVEINDALLAIVGYERDEVLGPAFDWSSLTPPEWRHVDVRARAQITETGVGELREKELIRKDGVRVPVLIGSAMVESANEAVSFVLDLTERKKAEETIARLEAGRAADAKFRSLLEAAPDGIVITDRERRIVLVNERAEAMFGYSRYELVGQLADMLTPPRCLPAADGTRADPRRFGLRKDGTEFPADVTQSPIPTEEGELLSYAIRDMTERLRADEARFRLAAIVDSSDDAIVGSSLEGIVQTWNRGATRLLGYEADEIIGRPLGILVPERIKAARAERLARLRAGERIDTLETFVRTKSGTEVQVSMTISPVFDANGVLAGVSHVARDITERKRAEDALIRTKLSLETANRELESFSYSVAHDLRAPLRGMNGFAQIVLETYGPKLDDDGRECLGKIMAGSRRMAALIDAMLSLAQVSRAALRRERVDISALATSIGSRLARTAPRPGLDFSVDPSLSAEADGVLVAALLENLLANAWKFTAPRENASIRVGVRRGGGAPAFFVKDDGVGFDMEYAKKLFEPFQRLHTVQEFPGTGIGLATVRRIAERHGGRVWAEGTVDAGATFFFTLEEEVEP